MIAKLELIKGSVAKLEIAKGYEDLGEIGIDFFTCTVDGKTMEGRFYKVEFKDGETIEFIVENTAKGALVQAARNPAQRILWMLPYQTRGHSAQKRSDIKRSLVLSFGAAAAATFFFYVESPPRADEPIWFTPATFLSIFLGMLLSISWSGGNSSHSPCRRPTCSLPMATTIQITLTYTSWTEWPKKNGAKKPGNVRSYINRGGFDISDTAA